MHQLEEIRWISHEGLRAQLKDFLRQPAPALSARSPNTCDAENESRYRAATLLAHIADEACVPDFQRLLLDHREEQAVRRVALGALAHLGAALPERELQALLEEVPSWYDTWPPHAINDALALCRSEGAQQIARTYLESLTPAARAGVLWHLVEDRVPPELADWLYERWLHADRALLEGVPSSDRRESAPLNWWVARATRERRESQAFLLEFWRAASGEKQRELLGRMCDERHELPRDLIRDASERREFAEALLLSQVQLLEYFGLDRLLDVIEQKMREASRADNDRHSSDAWRAMELLTGLPGDGVDERIRSLFWCPDLDADLKEDFFYQVLAHRSVGLAASLAQVAATRLRQYAFARRMVWWLAPSRCAEGGAFLEWATTTRLRIGAAFTYHLIQAAEAHGVESEHWRRRLAELSHHRNVYIRLHAAAALVRRGGEDRLAEIVSNSAQAKDVCVRAEALRLLGELDAERHFPILRRALLEDHEAYGILGVFAPAAEEAALALARLGTPEAMTALLQAYFGVPVHYAWVALDEYLVCLLTPADRPPEPVETPWPLSWRYREHPLRRV